jgi:predicted aspartyl protease
MRASSLILVLPLLVSAAPPRQMPANVAQDQTSDVRIVKDANERMTVAVRVRDSGPYRFLVDTGAERTVISRQLAERLGLPAGARTRMQSVAGPSVVSTVDIAALDIDARRLSVAGAPTLESEHIGADGLLGVDSLAASRVMFDFKRGVMGVTPSKAPDFRAESGTIVVEARRRHGRLMFTRAVADGAGAVVVVDTGSQISIGNPALRRRLLGNRPLGQPVEIETVAGEKIVGELYTIDVLDLDGVQLKRMTIAFTDSPVFGQLDLADRPALLLGMNALRGFNKVSIDFATRRVRFFLPDSSMADVLALSMQH